MAEHVLWIAMKHPGIKLQDHIKTAAATKHSYIVTINFIAKFKGAN